MRERVEEFSRDFMAAMRRLVVSPFADARRLPRWAAAARVSAGIVDDHAVFLVDDSQEAVDAFRWCGQMGVDGELYFQRLPNGLGAGRGQPLLPAQGVRGMSTYGDVNARPPVFEMRGHASFVDTSTNGSGALALADVFLRVVKHGQSVPHAVRYVPFAMYVPLESLDPQTGSEILAHVKQTLERDYASERGDMFLRQHERKQAVCVQQESSVVILGSYKDHLVGELLVVRDHLVHMGYDAEIISDFPDSPAMTNDQKVRAWTCAARFCVMIDREPGGHLAEYPVLKAQQTVLALLTPRSGPSSAMIGEGDAVNVRHFTFDEGPLEVVDEAVAWAEDVYYQRSSRRPT